MTLTPRDVRNIVDSALGSLNNAVISGSAVSTSVLVGGKCVATITPFLRQLRIQCIHGLGVGPRKGHLKQERSQDEGWEVWVTSTTTGLASFVHQVAPALGRMSDRVQSEADESARAASVLKPVGEPIIATDLGEGLIVRKALRLSPGDVEEIAILWDEVAQSHGVTSARARAIRAVPGAWGTSRQRVLDALDNRRRELGDDLPWDSARAAALDALRATLAAGKLAPDERDALSMGWAGGEPRQ